MTAFPTPPWTVRLGHNCPMIVEHNVALAPHNSFGIVAKARELVRVGGEADVVPRLADPDLAARPKFVLGGGSNIVLTGDVRPLVLKVEIAGRRVLDDGPRATVVEVGAGENWHEAVAWTLDQGFPGLENLALIPGTVGASPVQNVGAYGVELQCRFGYRDSVFKHPPPDDEAAAAEAAASPRGMGLAGRALILRVRLRLPK